MSKKSISETRQYKVLTTVEAKNILSNFFEAQKFNVDFGLPEIDDRYHIWRVPILYSNETIGTYIIDAFTGNIVKDRSTKLELLIERKNSIKPIEQKKHTNKKEKYIISDLPNMLINGDSTEELEKLPENSVDLIFTSPPYYNARVEYSEFKDYNSYLELIREIINKSSRVLIDGKFFVINISPVLIPRASRNQSSKRIAVPFDIHQLFIEEGFEFVDDIIWQKPEGAGWASGRGRRFSADRNPMQYKPVPVTEYVLVYRKKGSKLIDWFIRNHPNREIIEESKVEDDYDKTNVWYISPARDKRHRAIFPQELAKRVIKYYSFKNDVVLDPFGGLGTTGKAALSLERRFVSIELDKEYFDASASDFNKLRNIFNPDIEIIKKEKGE
ncbi:MULTISPECIES: DNA-methyltransferase [Staphylococcus]|uniref:DNA-methyltransferase n=1 Tax=Staphylococcus TaxID=1279 RepID=UPI00118A53A8|nr:MULTISPECIES: site-specific DNA-methyltransferase [Staphylococcus]MEB8123852.1 site-specific DNA-methyltransferase [Staphylococcus succinus]QDX04584.1 site-specific DNA-methyltransferase [Staphylococcus saprophyticus]